MTKINWKLRFKNKATVVALLSALVALIYQVLSGLNITPSISQDTMTQGIGMILNMLAMLGIIVDPTTQGVADSDQALTYTDPK